MVIFRLGEEAEIGETVSVIRPLPASSPTWMDESTRRKRPDRGGVSGAARGKVR